MRPVRPHLLDVTVLLVGVVMVAVSGVMAGGTPGWWQNALLTIGAAVVLGVILRWVAAAVREATRAATAAADQANQAAATATHEASEAREYADAAATSEAQVRADIASLDEKIETALSRDQLPVVLAARAAAQSQTPSALRELILKAREIGSLSTAPPMVPIREAPTFWVRVDATDGGIKVQLGREKQPLDAPWIEIVDDDLVGKLIELGDQLQVYAPQLVPEPQHLLGDVAELLEIGGRDSNRYGLFAQFGDWGSAPAFVIYLGSALDVPVRQRARNYAVHPATNMPKGLSPEERRHFTTAQARALDWHAWFQTPKRR